MEASVNMVNEESIFRKTNVDLTGEDILMLSPLQLAYIGDAVYELMVRTFLLNKNLNVNELHRAATEYVKARAQSEIIHHLDEMLTEEEKTMVKRGRNTKSKTSPKNVDMIDYKYATGFESLFGYLYLLGRDDRIYELFEKIVEFKKKD